MLRNNKEIIEAYLEILDELFQQERHSQKDINEANIVLKQLRILNVDEKDKSQHDLMKTKITTYTNKLNQLQKTLLLKPDVASSNHSSIFSNPDKDKKSSLEILEDSKNELLRTEQIGIQTLNQLTLQREKINKIKDNTKEINEHGSQSNSLLVSMRAWWRG